MSEKDGGPAFPIVDANREADYGTYGLTKLEWFAGMALIGLITNDSPINPEDDTGNIHADLAEMSVDYAEAMIAELEKRKS